MSKKLAFLMVCLLFLTLPAAAVQGTQDTVSKEELSKSMDKAIKILNAVKEEVDRSAAKDKKIVLDAGKDPAATGSMTEKALAENVGVMVRLWKKVQNIMGVQATDAQVKEKLDSTIRTLGMIKEEIEKGD